MLSGNLSKVLSVLDVGDGACSVLRHDEHVAIIDCGSNDLTADAACDRLLAAVGGHPEVITTIVVTHFDTDHYAGFLRLADRMSTRGILFERLRLIAPRPPDEEPGYVARYLALAMTVTGIRNLDLATALSNVTVEDEFSYLPVSRDLYSQFMAAGLRFRVRWPPVKLPHRVAGEVRTAMGLYGVLARNLRAAGNSALDNNLKRARYGDWPYTHRYDAEGVYEEAELQRQRDAIDLRGEDDEVLSDFPEVEALDLPDELKGQFTAAWDAFRRANNNMSIVCDGGDRHSIVAFGDAGEPVLRWLMSHGDLAPRYDVMLAPHHGTRCLPENFCVRAGLCISQNGSRRGDLWPRHVESHRNPNPGSCVTTRFGNHHIHIWDD